MTNQPLNSIEQSKILIFILILAPAVVFLVGAIPALVLVFGLIMMRKQEDFSKVEAAAIVFRSYMLLAFMVSGCASVWLLMIYLDGPDRKTMDAAIFLGVCAMLAAAYLVIFDILFFKPLASHKDWIQSNGIWASKPRSRKSPAFDITRGEGLRSYSVADELLKWAKLKEEGHISGVEYDDARKKLLQRA